MRTSYVRSLRQRPCFYQPGRASCAVAILCFVAVLVFSATVTAQQIDTAKPLSPVYNWPPSGFIINPGLGLNTPLTRLHNNQRGFEIDYWLYVHQYGGNCAGATEVEDVDALHNSPYRDTANDRFGLGAGRASRQFRAGFGREVQFYPFDSVQAPSYHCQFYIRNGGDTIRSAPGVRLERWPNRAFIETFYDSSNASTTQPILANPLYYYDSSRAIYLMDRYPGDDSARDASDFLVQTYDHDDLKYSSRQFYFVTTAHLFDNPPYPAADSDAILKLEVSHEIPAGYKYSVKTGGTYTLVTAAVDTSILCDTFLISRKELRDGPPDLNQYRIISRGTDLRTRQIDGGPGPFHASQAPLGSGGSLRMDLRVFWTGKEKVAIQNIAVRDYVGELVLGDEPDAQDFRQSIIDDLWYKLYGTDDRAVSPDQFRREIIGIEVGREADDVPTEYAGFVEMNRILKDTFNLADWKSLHGLPLVTGDSLGASQINKGNRPSTDYLLQPTTISCEVSYTDNRDTSIAFVDSAHQSRTIFETPHHAIPTFKQHNGGRGQLPILMDLDSVGLSPAYDATLPAKIEDYETTFQRMQLGRSDVGKESFYFDRHAALGSMAGAIAGSARKGRVAGRQVGSVIYTYASLQGRWNPVQNQYDTLLMHRPEPAELRASANLMLAYGVHSFAWGGMSDYTTVGMETKTVGGVTYYSNTGVDNSCCFGSSGYYTPSDTINLITSYDLYSGGVPRIKFPNLWIGWQNTHGEIKHYDTTYLAKIGPELAKLRWRDGYSMHFTTPWPGLAHDTASRPLPSTELVNNVQTFAPGSSTPDSAHRTFVELSFFDVKNATNKAVLDTQHIFVVNRRTFERPPEISATSAAGRKLDSLAETRRIRLSFNMRHPDPLAYNYIHVREVMPDTNRIPLAETFRKGLDTVVYGDKDVNLTLRPGGAALLEVTYWQPGMNMAGGNIRFNNQRKLIGDSNRYYAVYFHKIKYYWPFEDMPGQPKKKIPRFEDQVFMRRSLPMADTVRGIRWEPNEFLVSDTTADSSIRENRYPSITERIVGADTVITAVWDGYGNDGRVIWMKNVRYHDTLPPDASQQVHIGTHSYAWSLDTLWGTPVVSHLHGGDIVAWSDTLAGIVSRFRSLGSGTNWWKEFASGVSYSGFDTVSKPFTLSYGPGLYPSMPPFAHIAGKDSNIAIVWQQPTALNRIAIKYIRMVDTVQTGTHKIRNVLPYLTVSHNEDSINLHPSIDMTQDVWYGAQEGVTWESFDQPFTSPAKTTRQTTVHVSSLWTTTHHLDPNYSPEYDSIGVTSQWTYNTFIAAQPYAMVPPPYQYVYPSISSINDRFDTLHQHELISFALALAPVTTGNDQHPMRQTMVQYAVHDPLLPLDYIDLGTATLDPNGAGSMKRQSNRHAVLYVENPGTSPVMLNSSRQFYALKGARPSGYAAKGRQLYFRIDDSLNTGMTAMLHDVWIAGAETGQALAMTPRPERLRVTDSLDEVRDLFRTANFTAHDSTTIGWTIKGRCIADSASAVGMSATFVTEVIDSATGHVVATIDSFQTAPGIAPYWSERDSTLDLLSGTYYVRMRIETEGLPTLTVAGDSRYPVEEVASFVPGVRLGKVQRIDAVAGATGRLSVHPNPTVGPAEILFSVPEQGPVSVTIYDARGQRIAQPMDGRITEAGRYAIDIDGGTLAAGTYLIEFRYGENRLVEKLVVVQ
ncbi:MAG: Filamentous hemagglutinin family outer membrane protein [Chlorobi bacterium]|nr:Filamentous hemagglutinin family outer membrane protein [Chlorobiota bacterium]